MQRIFSTAAVVCFSHHQSSRADAEVVAPGLQRDGKAIPELQAAMESRQVTSRQLVEHYLARIAAYDKNGPALHAIVAINPEGAADRRRTRCRAANASLYLVVGRVACVDASCRRQLDTSYGRFRPR